MAVFSFFFHDKLQKGLRKRAPVDLRQFPKGLGQYLFGRFPLHARQLLIPLGISFLTVIVPDFRAIVQQQSSWHDS